VTQLCYGMRPMMKYPLHVKENTFNEEKATTIKLYSCGGHKPALRHEFQHLASL